MSVSVFSALTALLLFDAAILACTLLRRRTKALGRLGPWPFLFALAAGALRLLMPVTLTQTQVIHSARLLPAMQELLGSETLFSLELYQLLLAVWGLGTAAGTAELLVRLLRTRRALAGLAALRDERIEAAVREAVHGAPFRLTVTSGADAPMMAGYFRAFFVMPAYMRELSDEALRLVVLHEWTHFLRRDNWRILTLELLIRLLWWNLPLYLLRRELSQFAEISCDRRVTQKLSRKGKAAYLEALVCSLRASSRSGSIHTAARSSGAGFMADMQQRFKLVSSCREGRGRALGAAAAAAAAGLWAASLFVVIQPFNVLSAEEMARLNISGYESRGGGTYIAESADGKYVEYIYGEPVFGAEALYVEYVSGKGTDYLALGADGDGGARISVNARDGTCCPIYVRTGGGELELMELPEGISPAPEPEPAGDKEETIDYFHIEPESGERSVRTWSVTYRRWVTRSNAA